MVSITTLRSKSGLFWQTIHQRMSGQPEQSGFFLAVYSGIRLAAQFGTACQYHR
jgi:hypothetical protein